jgi:hypothetical protein
MANEQPRNRDRSSGAAAPLREPSRSQRDRWAAPPGQVVMGPSFYVWDESPRQAREWGIELANAWLAYRR